jgi:hypothetical protein
MSDIYDILEICLDEIEKGADIDSVLLRYPTYASELRPLLETAARAIKVHIPEPADAVVRRNRVKILHHAAQLRESQLQTTARRLWSVPLRRILVTLVVVGVLFVGSTELVRASSMTLPGDNLYPVKRTWEDVHVLFTFNLQAREALEVEHENERLHELRELFTQGRSVTVDFSGLVTRQNGDLWLVAGVPVATSAQTDLPTQVIAIGDAIRVIGVTQADGAVLAQRIELLPNGMPLPDLEDDESFEHESSGTSTPAAEGDSRTGSGDESNAQATETPESNFNSASEQQSFHGKVQSINGNILVVNGQILNVSSAQVIGTPRVGSSAKVQGYYDANGVFIVTRIEFEQSDSGGGDSVTNDHEDDGSNEDHHDDETTTDDHHEEEDSHDSSGGDD